MASKTEYQLRVKLGAATAPSWKTTLGKAEEALSGLDSLSNKIMAGIGVGVTAAAATATAAISGAVEKYADFESEMATVQSISGATGQQFLEMREAALEAGSGTVFTATEAASALEYMSLAGWGADESISGLVPILELAAATGKELQTTSDLVTDSMSALGLEVADLDMYLDKLVQGNNKANNTAEQLMEGLVESGGAARALGADLDDAITALGVLANNGTKGAGNTTALKELDRLDVALWDDEGKFIGFEESLGRINSALAELTDEDRTMSLKNIAGTHYYSQMAYLLKAVTEATDESGNAASAWQELEAQVSDSSGALRNMYDTTTDTLLFAQKRLDSAKEDMQIRVADVFADDAKDFLLWLSERMPEATESIVEFAEAHRGEFADALETVGEGIEMLWENGIAAGQWIIKHRGALTGGLKAVAGGFVLVKGALAGIKIAQLFTNPLSGALTVAGLAATAIGAVAGAIRDAEREAVNADLAAHFGSLSLSMSEIEDVAQRILESDYLTGVVESLEAFGELDSFSDNMEDAAKTLDKLDWKISIGMELTAEESESYKQAIEDYVESAQEYALQSQYAVSLNLQYAFSEDDLESQNVVAKVNQFYQDKYDELSLLGKRLNETLTGSFNDGLLDIEKAPIIADIQRQMAEIEESLATGEFDARLSAIAMEYKGGGSLTADSFQDMQEEIMKQVEVANEAYRNAYVKNYASLQATYEGGELTEAEYRDAQEALTGQYMSNISSNRAKGVNFLLDTIMEQYSGEAEEYMQGIQEAIAEHAGNEEWWGVDPNSMLIGLLSEADYGGPDKSTRKAIAELLEPMLPSIEEMQSYRRELEEIGMEIPESLATGISNFSFMDALSQADFMDGSAADVLGRQIAESEYGSFYKGLLEELDRSGVVVPDKLMESVNNAAAMATAESVNAVADTFVSPAVKGIYAYAQECVNQTFSGGLHAVTELHLTVTPSVSRKKLPDYRSLELSDGIMSNAAGGIYSRPILTTFAEEGPEAAVPLDGSMRAKSIWAKAGQILGMLPQGSRDQSILAGASGQREDMAGGNIQLHYNPVVTIRGSASEKEVQKMQDVLKDHLDDLQEMIAEIERESRRTAFG